MAPADFTFKSSAEESLIEPNDISGYLKSLSKTIESLRDRENNNYGNLATFDPSPLDFMKVTMALNLN